MDIFLQLIRPIAVLPIVAMGLTSPFVAQPSYEGLNAVHTASAQEIQKENDILLEQSGKIDTYFKKRGMPLQGFGKKMVKEAKEHDLDWRLLPALAVQESSGGIQACRYNSYNVFGWDSCGTHFKSYDDAIEVVARNLGGDNPNTSDYYSGATESKLHSYNGSVVRTYEKEVFAKMEAIGE